MHVKGEVEGGRAGRQLDDVAFGREDKDLFLKQIDFNRLEKLVGIFDFLLPLHDLPQPGKAL